MNNQLAALIADSGRAPSAPVPALHDQFQLASLLGDARSDQCDLTGADLRGATTDGLALIDCPADGADFRGTHWED